MRDFPACKRHKQIETHLKLSSVVVPWLWCFSIFFVHSCRNTKLHVTYVQPGAYIDPVEVRVSVSLCWFISSGERARAHMLARQYIRHVIQSGVTHSMHSRYSNVFVAINDKTTLFGCLKYSIYMIYGRRSEWFKKKKTPTKTKCLVISVNHCYFLSIGNGFYVHRPHKNALDSNYTAEYLFILCIFVFSVFVDRHFLLMTLYRWFLPPWNRCFFFDKHILWKKNISKTIFIARVFFCRKCHRIRFHFQWNSAFITVFFLLHSRIQSLEFHMCNCWTHKLHCIVHLIAIILSRLHIH